MLKNNLYEVEKKGHDDPFLHIIALSYYEFHSGKLLKVFGKKECKKHVIVMRDKFKNNLSFVIWL